MVTTLFVFFRVCDAGIELWAAIGIKAWGNSVELPQLQPVFHFELFDFESTLTVSSGNGHVCWCLRLTSSPHRSPTRQAIRHCPRHHLQPRCIPRSSRPSLRWHLPPRPSCQLKGGVCQVKGGCLCCCRLRNFPCRKRHSIIRCWCFDQCYRYSLLQGSRLFGIFDLLRQLCPICMSSIMDLKSRSPYCLIHY